MTDKIKKNGTFSALRGFHKAVPFLLFAIAIYVGLCFITESTGVFGTWLSKSLRGLFSVGAYFLPVFLILHALFYARDLYKKTLITRILFSLLALIMISALSHASSLSDIGFEPKIFFANAKLGEGGGFVGGIVAYATYKIIGKAGIIILAILSLVLYLVYTFSSSKKILARIALKALTRISESSKRHREKKEKLEAFEEEVKKKDEIAKQNELTKDDFFSSSNTISELSIPKLGIREVNTAVLSAPASEPETEPKTQKSEIYESKNERRSRAVFDYGIDSSLPTPKPQESAEAETSTRYNDENADDVFNAHFNAFDFKINAELAGRPSSKSIEKEKSEPVSEIATPIYKISEEDVERARQRADFEMKKRVSLEADDKHATAVGSEETLEFGKPPVEDAISEDIYDSVFKENEVYTEDAESEISDFSQSEDIREYSDSQYEECLISEDSEQEPTIIMQREVLEADTSCSDFYDEEEDRHFSDSENGEDTADCSESAEEDIEDGEDSDSYYAEIPPEEQNPKINEYRKMFSFLEDSEEEEAEEEPTDITDIKDSEDVSPFETNAQANQARSEATKPEAPKKKEESTEKKPDYSKYKFPPIDLLHVGHIEEDNNSDEETKENAEKLVETLAQFSVKVSLKGYDRGPRITRYEIVPAKGVKVNQVTNLFDDIALSMAADGIRMEAPIPGKSAIGVEIPNKKPSLVFLRDLIESEDFRRKDSKTCAAIGKDVTGNPVIGDIATMPHVLIAGATGMGKSVCINAVLISILYKARPDEVKFIMIDPKRVEFNSYNGIPHLLIPVVTEVKQAAGALMWAVEQMNKRYDLMGELEVKKLDEYNELVRENPSLGEPLPKIIIVIDELNDIMLQARKPVEGLIMSIAQKARAAGIHLILGTQRPSVDVITGVIKSNIPSRISCKVMSFQDSKTIIDQAGAEKLLNNGDMLYFPNGSPKPLRVQGAYVSNSEVSQIMKFLKEQTKGQDIYDQKALDEINNAAKKCVKGGSDDSEDEDGQEENSGILNDQQFLDAVDLAIKSGKISTSLIQRRIGVGYGKAAKFIDYMEDLGIVSEPNGQKPRDILIDKSTWHEMLARRAID